MLEDNDAKSHENGDESMDAEKIAKTTRAKKAKKSTSPAKVEKTAPFTYSTIDMAGTIVLLADNKNKITKFRGNTLRDRIKIGEILAQSHKKLAKHEGGTKFYKAWVKDVLRMSSTDAINARRLHKLYSGTFKSELKALDLEYRNALNYSIVETALFAWENVLNPPKGTSSKKATNLESLEFLSDAIVLKFKGSDDEHDLSKLSVRELKKLLDPSTKTPQKEEPRQTVSDLQELLKLAREDNEALQLQLKVLTEKIGLLEGGASQVAETETPADVIAPSESTSGGESVDVPATHMGAEQ